MRRAFADESRLARLVQSEFAPVAMRDFIEDFEADEEEQLGNGFPAPGADVKDMVASVHDLVKRALSMNLIIGKRQDILRQVLNLHSAALTQVLSNEKSLLESLPQKSELDSVPFSDIDGILAFFVDHTRIEKLAFDILKKVVYGPRFPHDLLAATLTQDLKANVYWLTPRPANS